MKYKWILFIAALFAPILSMAQIMGGGKNVKELDTWGAFPEGSWKIVKEEQSFGVKKQSSTSKYFKAEGGKVDVFDKSENGFELKRNQTHFLSGFDPRNSKDFGKPVVEKVKLTVDGKNYDCDLETYTFLKKVTETESKKTVIKYWRCKDVLLPYRTVGKKGPDLALGQHVLKAYFKNDFPKLKEEATVEVVKINDKQKVGDQVISCCVENISQVMEHTRSRRGVTVRMKAAGKLVQITSRDVPGHLVKLEGGGTLTENGKESQVSILKEVTEFKVIKSR